MKQTTVGIYRVFRRGKKIVAHTKWCKQEGCTEDVIQATEKQVQGLLNATTRRLSSMTEDGREGHTVTYPDSRRVKIGCTTLDVSTIKRILKLSHE